MVSCRKRAWSRPRPWSRHTKSPLASRLARRACQPPSPSPRVFTSPGAGRTSAARPPAAPGRRSEGLVAGRIGSLCRPAGLAGEGLAPASASAGRRWPTASPLVGEARRLVEDMPPRRRTASRPDTGRWNWAWKTLPAASLSVSPDTGAVARRHATSKWKGMAAAADLLSGSGGWRRCRSGCCRARTRRRPSWAR